VARGSHVATVDVLRGEGTTVVSFDKSFGKYELLRRIALGGMAEVFVARMTGAGGFEKTVALKRMLPELGRRPEFVNMFLDEARIAASLNHPNIVEVYEIGEVDGAWFMTMEYLRGQDLRTLLGELRASGEGMPFPLALRLISQVASGLHHAHEKRDGTGRPLGIVHRDVSPKNVFITFDGVIKLLDFGIAKAHRRLAKTQSGTVKGRYPYMAPEQIREEAIDRRSDVFALGILLWEVTTGRRLFVGKSAYEILKKIRDQPIPLPSQVMPAYPAALEAVVMRALSKDPAARYPTCLAMQRDLEAVGALGAHQSAGEVAALMEELFGTGLRTPAPAFAPCEADEVAVEDDVETPLLDVLPVHQRPRAS
jgi:serine/threonine protein kinase